MEWDVLQLVAHGQRLLGKRARLGEPPRLAEVFGHVDGDQPEPARIGDGAGHALGFPQVGQHLLELAEPVERAPQFEAHIDLLLPRLRRLRQVAQRFQRLFEGGQSLTVRRLPLGLECGLPETGRGLVPHLPAPKVVGHELDDLVSMPGVHLLEAEPGRRVVLTSPALQHARVHDVLGQRVLEAVHQLGVLRTREDEVEGMQVPQVPGHLLGDDLEDARDQRNAEASPHHRRPLERLLERFRDAVDAGRDDVVDGRRDCHVGAAELRLAVLDGDSARLLQLVENLLDVERILAR